MPSRVSVSLALLCAAALLLPALGCRPLFRYKAAGAETWLAPQQRETHGLDPFVLTNVVSDRLVLEVDWVEGHRPSERALAELEQTAARYLPEGKRFEVVLDDTIPRARWEELTAGDHAASALVAAYLDRDPDRWREFELVHVLYVPRGAPLYGSDHLGLVTDVTFERDGRVQTVQVLNVFKEATDRQALLWLGPEKVDRTVLVHEFGHVLGLTRNPEHEQRGNPHHCTEPGCVMIHARARTLVYNLPRAVFTGQLPIKYCKRCRADLAAARAIWSERVSDPGFRSELLETRRFERDVAAAAWLERRGRAHDAVTRLVAGASANPDGPPGYPLGIARLQRFLGRLDDAMTALDEAQRRGADSSWTSALRGDLLCDAARYEAALEALPERTESEHLELALALVRSRALAGLGRADEAAALIGGFVDRIGAPARGWQLRLERWAGVRRSAEERDALWRELAERPDLLLPLARQEGELDRLETLARSLVRRKRTPEIGWAALALAAAARGDADAAAAAMLRHGEYAGGGPNPSLARVHALLGDAEAAMAIWHDPDLLFAINGEDPCLDPDYAAIRGSDAFFARFPGCAGD